MQNVQDLERSNSGLKLFAKTVPRRPRQHDRIQRIETSNLMVCVRGFWASSEQAARMRFAIWQDFLSDRSFRFPARGPRGSASQGEMLLGSLRGGSSKRFLKALKFRESEEERRFENLPKHRIFKFMEPFSKTSENFRKHPGGSRLKQRPMTKRGVRFPVFQFF